MIQLIKCRWESGTVSAIARDISSLPSFVYNIFFLLKCIVINVKSLFIFSLSHPEMSLSTRVASSSPFWWLHLYVYKADGCVLDKTVTLWICIQQCCIIVYLYVWIYTRRLLVQIYSGGYIVWIRVEMSFLLIFSPPFFSLCVNWKRSYMISETHLHPGAQLAKDKSWGTTMSRAFRHFLLPFPFRRLLRCALTTSDRKSQKIKKKKCMGIVCNMQRAEPAQWRWKAQKGGKRRRRRGKKSCALFLCQGVGMS